MTHRDELLLYSKIKTLGLTPNEYFYLILRKTDRLSSINFDRSAVEKSFVDKGYSSLDDVQSLVEEADDSGLKELCDKYRLIFPKGVLPSGKAAKSTSLEVRHKMRWFLQTHDYPHATILAATQKYVEHFKQQNYNYMQTASYFIYKDDKNKVRQSVLAEWCENINDLSIDNNENFGIDV